MSRCPLGRVEGDEAPGDNEVRDLELETVRSDSILRILFLW